MYGLNQPVVKTDGDVFFRQTGLHGILITADPGIKVTAAAGSGQRGGQRIPVMVIGVHQAEK